MLARKVRQLEDRVAQLNQESHHVRTALSTSDDRTASLEGECSRQRELIQRLEVDLSHAGQAVSAASGDVDSRPPNDLLQDFVVSNPCAQQEARKGAGAEEQHANILSVVTGQRDRFKERLMKEEVRCCWNLTTAQSSLISPVPA